MISPQELTVLINTISIAIAQDRSDNELEVLAAAFTQIGDTLATIAVQRGIIKE